MPTESRDALQQSNVSSEDQIQLLISADSCWRTKSIVWLHLERDGARDTLTVLMRLANVTAGELLPTLQAAGGSLRASRPERRYLLLKYIDSAFFEFLYVFPKSFRWCRL